MKLAQLWRLGNIGSKKTGDKGTHMLKIIEFDSIVVNKKVKVRWELKKYKLSYLDLGSILP